MKKTYIIPSTLITSVSAESMIAESTTMFRGDDQITNASEILVKENNRPSYNVWDDDWSAE